MKVYTSTLAFARKVVAAIVAAYNRFVAFIRSDVRRFEAEYATLKTRLEALEASSVQEIAQIKADIRQREQYVFALESCLTSDLSKHLESIKYLHATKRESPNVIGEKPALLK